MIFNSLKDITMNILNHPAGFLLLTIIASIIGNLIVKMISNYFKKYTIKETSAKESFNNGNNPPSTGRHVIVSSDGAHVMIGYFDKNANQGRGGWFEQGGKRMQQPLYWIDIVKFKLKYTIDEN